MTRRVPSAQTANQAIKIAFATMIALLAVVSLASEANAVPWALRDFKREHLQYTGQEQWEAALDTYSRMPGLVSNAQAGRVAQASPEVLAAKIKNPQNVAPQARAHAQAQATQSGNNAGDIAREQAIQSIDYCSRVMKNFTTEGGNRWNRYRDNFFIPMALLLILPGAVLTQVRAIIAQGNPILAGQSSPIEGIYRAIVGVFLVPCTYLVVNYSIDLGNSLQYTIATEYHRIQGTDMYEDAMCAEIRAFGVRHLKENEGSSAVPPQDKTPRGNEPFAKLEGKIWGKLSDPCVGLNLVPANRDDQSMEQGSLGVRLAMNMTNAGINTAWSILTAFQMAFMYYLFFVGPIMAALWVWPVKMMKDALPAWIEGVITLAFWSFFWNVVILIIALTKSEASSGLYIVTACNFLASAAVKYAFDFAGLMRGAAAEAEKLGAKAAQQGGKGGGKGGKGGSKSNNSSTPAAGTQPQPTGDQNQPNTTVPLPRPRPKVETIKAATSLPTTIQYMYDAAGNLVPKVVTLDPSITNGFIPVTGFSTTLPPQARIDQAVAAVDTTSLINPIQNPALTFVPTTDNASWTAVSPPLAGGQRILTRNTIGSVIGNSIQQVMAYPLFARLIDPDRAKREQAQQQEVEEFVAEEPVEEYFAEALQEMALETEKENEEPAIASNTPTEENETEEAEMKKVDPRLEDERFSFTPPPLVESDKGKTFDSTMSVSDIPMEVQTCNSLLSKMADLVESNDNEPAEFAGNLYVPQTMPQVFAPQQVEPAQMLQPLESQQGYANAFAEELAKVYSAYMPQVFAEQEAQRQTTPNYTAPIQAFCSQAAPEAEAEVVTVVDYTAMAATAPVAQAVQPAQQARQTNSGLSSILRNRGAVKAPVNQDVSNSWFA